MGAGSSRKYNTSDNSVQSDYAMLDAERKLQEKISVPLQVLVAHYTPSSFPLVPVIHKKNTELCRESWKKIISTDVPDPYGGPTISGITAFYSEFYDR
jgi:hypothetical protein